MAASIEFGSDEWVKKLEKSFDYNPATESYYSLQKRIIVHYTQEAKKKLDEDRGKDIITSLMTIEAYVTKTYAYAIREWEVKQPLVAIVSMYSIIFHDDALVYTLVAQNKEHMAWWQNLYMSRLKIGWDYPIPQVYMHRMYKYLEEEWQSKLRCIEQTKRIKENLMMAAWHPRRIQRILDIGDQELLDMYI